MVQFSVMQLISKSVALTAANGGICLLGDYLVDLNHESQIRKAICDNVTHAAVGFFSALVLILETNHRAAGTERIALLVMSVFVSSFIDIDHFLVAKSMQLSVIFLQKFTRNENKILMMPFLLQRAVAIDRRPFLHFTTIPLVLVILIVPLYQWLHSSRLNLWLSVLTCAFLCHHTRDATRRGFTLWPFGTTKPLPYPLYIALVMIMPFLSDKWLNIVTNDNQYRYRTLEVLTV